MSGIELKSVKGTRDFYPEDLRLQNWLFDQWRQVAARFGFEEYDSCILEHEALYTRKAGDEIVGQLYNFTDKGDRRVALRPEMTPTLARMVMARLTNLSLPLRWFAIPQCFRYERMQRGRKREHYQWNMDIIGLEHVAAEVELMSAQIAFLQAVGINVSAAGAEIRLRVSDRRVLQGFLEDLGITGEQFAAVCVIIDKVDKIGRDATIALLVADEVGIPADVAGRILDVLTLSGIDELAAAVGEANPGVASLRALVALGEASGIGHLIHIDPSVVRGLSYYTGTVWEIFAAAGSFQRAIAGGGRYDRLMEMLGGKPVPMVGFGLGDVPICELLTELKRLPELGRQLDEFIYPMSDKEFVVANRIAAQLRATGKQVQVDYSQRRFKHVVKAAEQAGATQLWVLGGNEVKEGIVKVRTLADRQERSEDLAPYLAAE